jgi:hypothetical protein
MQIVVPSFNDFRNFSPSVSEGLVSLNELHFLVVAPLIFIDCGIQVIMPSKKTGMMSNEQSKFGKGWGENDK